MVCSTCNGTIYSTLASWVKNTTYICLWGEAIPSGTFSAMLHEILPHCIWSSEVHSLLRFWQTPQRSHVGYKPEVSEQILGGSFLLSRVPDSQAHHRERLDELACWGGHQQRQRSPQELSEGRQRRTQKKNRGEQSDIGSKQGPPIYWLDISALRLKRVSVRCQYFPFHLD